MSVTNGQRRGVDKTKGNHQIPSPDHTTSRIDAEGNIRGKINAESREDGINRRFYAARDKLVLAYRYLPIALLPSTITSNPLASNTLAFDMEGSVRGKMDSEGR